MTTAKLHATRIEIPVDTRVKMIELLNTHLGSLSDLYSQTKQAHWNVKGIHFIALHELFDKLAASLPEFTDLVAERVTTLGGTALGTVRLAAKGSKLPEYPLDALDGKEHVKALVDRWAAYSTLVRAGIDTAAAAGDADTADIFTEISREVDKSLWFLESHLV
jgi:starvation-inducible DNA-binding protein